MATNAATTGVKIGDRVRWTSAAGDIRAEVVGMRLGLNAAKQLIPWIMCEYTQMNRTQRVELCGSESYLAMMKFKVNFRG